MKKLFPCSTLVVASFVALTGCSTPTVLTLNDGREIQAVDTPEFDDETGLYDVEQLDGKVLRINKDQIRTVKDLE